MMTWMNVDHHVSPACRRMHLVPQRMMSMARALPMALMRRCVPPMPGMTPSDTSGCTNPHRCASSRPFRILGGDLSPCRSGPSATTA